MEASHPSSHLVFVSALGRYMYNLWQLGVPHLDYSCGDIRTMNIVSNLNFSIDLARVVLEGMIIDGPQ